MKHKMLIVSTIPVLILLAIAGLMNPPEPVPPEQRAAPIRQVIGTPSSCRENSSCCALNSSCIGLQTPSPTPTPYICEGSSCLTPTPLPPVPCTDYWTTGCPLP